MARDGGFITGMLTGALAGAAIAMIVAPTADTSNRDVLRAMARANARPKDSGAPNT